MKIGILTFFESENYGTVLQAYGLQHYLQSMGHQAELIHIKRCVQVASAPEAARQYSLLQRVLIKAVTLCHKKDLPAKSDAFRLFRKDYMQIAPHFYETEEDLLENGPEYDLYLSGGDQIWNPYHKVFSTRYMFDFLPPNAKRIAYGSSFGISQLNDEKIREKMQPLLEKYAAIGMRENSGVQILEQMGVRAQKVVDPVFLIPETWKEMANKLPKPHKKPYCLVYALVDYPTEEDRKIRAIAKEKGLDVVILPYNRRNCCNRYKKAFSLSPIAFLSWVANAEMVITNSFHGLAFSVIFQKQLAILPAATEEGKQKQGRLFDLIAGLGIAQPPLGKEIAIDYAAVSSQLAQQTEESRNWLNGVIKAENL